MRPVISAAVAAAALLGATGAAHAVSSVTFDMLSARFVDPQGGGGVDLDPDDGTFGDPARIRWGSSTVFDPDESGYDFNAATSPFTSDVDVVFDLGGFTHFNQPIPAGTSITGVTLEINGDISFTPDGGMESTPENRTFVFDILHDETSNGAEPCKYGGDNGQGVNENGCADRVLILEDFDTTQSFLIDGVEFTLDILGFFDAAADDGAGAFDQEFLSAEGGDNDRVLRARFTEKANIIPVPAGALLIGTALLGAGAVRRLSTRRG